MRIATGTGLGCLIVATFFFATLAATQPAPVGISPAQRVLEGHYMFLEQPPIQEEWGSGWVIT